MPPTLAEVRAQFEYFADVECGERAPLYAMLARSIADDEGLLALANEGREGVRRANLLLAAVHYLVLKHPEEPLAAIYRRGEADQGAPGVLRELVQRRREDVAELVRTRLVQTNEVNRCSALLPGLQAAQAAMGGRPLGLIDIGASAGLHLLFDHYQYRYSTGEQTGPPESPVTISCEVRGAGAVPAGVPMPAVATRVGVDMAPVDVTGADARLWLRALVWPEEPERMARLEAALSLAAAWPPEVRRGDALEALPGMVAEVEAGVVPVVHHSHVLAHMPGPARSRFTQELLPALGQQRDLAWLACEGSTMVLTTWRGGVQSETLLANRDPHGSWIEWLA